MKKLCLSLTVFFAFILPFCTSSKKTATKQQAKVTYMKDVQPLALTNCTPCHYPPKGNKKPLDTYMAMSANIDDVIIRIQKNPGERGFMPQRHPKLSDSAINVFVQWRTDGLLEK